MLPSQCNRRSGLTLFELLVAIVLVSVLASLIFPALLRARESGYRISCTNHLRQIGLGLQSYHGLHGSLPPGWMADGVADTGWGWASMLLPEIGEPSLYQTVDFGHPIGDGRFDELRRRSLPLMRCPSDPSPQVFLLYREEEEVVYTDQKGTVKLDESDALFHLPASNYVGIFGTTDPDEVSGMSGDGAFIANQGRRFWEMRDGLANTLIVGERTSRQLLSTWVGMDPHGEEGASRVVGFADHGPNDPLADECEFSSRHPRGANFLMADGHVTFIANSVDRQTFRRQATIWDPR